MLGWYMNEFKDIKRCEVPAESVADTISKDRQI
jgi:hypothetical protein